MNPIDEALKELEDLPRNLFTFLGIRKARQIIYKHCLNILNKPLVNPFTERCVYRTECTDCACEFYYTKEDTLFCGITGQQLDSRKDRSLDYRESKCPVIWDVK